MNTEDKIAYITVTEGGKELAYKLKRILGKGDIFVTPKIWEEGLFVLGEGLKKQVGTLFRSYDCLIFIMATGIVVRSIAPYLEGKYKDPAVLVMDEHGQFVISLLSGHMGGANEMTKEVAHLIGAQSVITTATDVNDAAALDNIAKSLHAYIENFGDAVKKVNYHLVHKHKVGLYVDGDYEVDDRGFIRLEDREDDALLGEMEAIVYISNKKSLKFMHPQLIKVIPKNLVIGIGCKKDTPIEHMYESFMNYLKKHNLDSKAIFKIGSIEIKKDEKAIKTLSSMLDVPFETVTKEAILEVEDLFDQSSFVKEQIGVGSVAEPVAYLLSGGHLISKRESYNGITFALGACKG